MSAEEEIARLRAQLALTERELAAIRKSLEMPPSRYGIAIDLGVSEKTVSRWWKQGLPRNATAAEAAAWRRDRACPELSRRVS